MELTTLLVFAFVFLISYFWFRQPDPRLPPSPLPPLPIVGHLLYISKDTRTQMRKWREGCGNIYSLYMGGTLAVVLNGYELINEALVKKADVFSDRPHVYLDVATGMAEKGVLFSSGKLWKEQRSVCISILRDLGMGKNILAVKIQEEVGHYLNYLASQKGKPIDIRVITNVSSSNVICSILIGHRFEYDDKKFQNLMFKLGRIVLDQDTLGFVNSISWLSKIPGDFFKVKTIASNAQAIMDLFVTFIAEKRRHVEDSSDVANFIDAYMMKKVKKIQAGISTSLDDQNLTKIMFDLFSAGTETTSSTIYWIILYMLHNPKVQEKAHQEIKDKVGTDRTPTMQDKSQLTYVNAVIMEAQRLVSVAPLSMPHMCSEEVTLRGYTLPKGTYIIPNLDSVLHDSATWGEDVMTFRPERFIDDGGKLKNPEEFIPFSIGRRTCLGEAMANMELFLFISSMFQRLQFLPPNVNSIPSLNYDCGGVILPKPFEVIIVERK